MTALYNEIDPKAAAWLRALIVAGHIAPGVVNEQSIEDLTPDYLRQFTQVHFFAGIGVWSYALRTAGWPDDRPVWTGSCPCQPFSAAGKGGGFDDERHLWPAFHWLISQCRPPIVFGEQVASKDGLGWIDLVQADLEGAAYASGALDFCSAGVGAPHIRQRLYWFGERLEHSAGDGRQQRWAEPSGRGLAGGRSADRLADACGQGLERRDARPLGLERATAERNDAGDAGRLADADGGDAGAERQQRSGEQRQQPQDGGAGGLGDAISGGRQSQSPILREYGDGVGAGGRQQVAGIEASGNVPVAQPATGPTNGFWGDADWLHCRDHKWRPVEPGTFPLAHGSAERVGRLRGYGNAIVAPAAQAFIQAYLDAAVI